ncbi:MFS transporter [Streptomyces sp. NPDC058657]|uniref:MFS transporter n=1 Tax=unclassified Streptomyces TaxID=2593676 RepID=UPI003647C3A6
MEDESVSRASASADPAVRTRRRLIAASLVSSIGDGIYVPLTMLFVHSLTGLSLTSIGAGLTVAGLCALLFMPVAGVLIDRFSGRHVLIGVLAMRAAGFAAYPFADSYPAFVAIALVVAVGMWASSPSQHALIGEIARGPERDRLLAWDRSLRNAGMGCGSLAAAGMLAWNGSAGFIGAAMALAAVFALAAVLVSRIPAVRGGTEMPRGAAAPSGPEAPGTVPAPRGPEAARAVADRWGPDTPHAVPDRRGPQAALAVTAQGGAEPALNPRGGYRQVLADRPYLFLTTANFLIAFGYTTQAIALPIFLTRDVGVPGALAGVVFALNTVLVAALGVPLARRTLRGRRTRTAAAGAGIFALSFGAFAALPHLTDGTGALVAVVAVAVLYTAGELVHSAPSQSLSVQAAPDHLRGRYLSVYQLSWSLCRTLAPVLLGFLLDSGQWQLWTVLALMVLAGAAILLCAERVLPAHVVSGGTTRSGRKATTGTAPEVVP